MAIYCGNAVAFALIMGGLLSGRAQRIPDSPIANNQSAHQSAQDSTPKHESNGIASWAIKYPDTFFAGVVAFFTTVLALSTVGLWVATLLIGRRQSREMQSHIGIARQSMIATGRAYISVRTVFLGRRPRSIESKFEGIATGFTLLNTGNIHGSFEFRMGDSVPVETLDAQDMVLNRSPSVRRWRLWRGRWPL